MRSTPAQATLLLDDRFQGLTPLQLALPRRPFTLTLQREGHHTWRRRLPGPPVSRQRLART